MPAKLDLSGKKFGKLLPLHISKKEKGKVYWMCLCDCGNHTEVAAGKIKFLSTKSCGCLRKPHGLSQTELYSTWKGIIRRCSASAKGKLYEDYYGRGITISEEWLGADGYIKFINHIGKRPSKEYSVDRINNNKGYQPGNVRWATKKLQASNTRRKRVEEFSNKELIDELKKRGILSPIK
jgi:hypothetical protein